MQILPRPCLCIAHRGASEYAPENTLAANVKAAELGAETACIETDEVTLEALRSAGVEPAADALGWCSDADAEYLQTLNYTAASLEPQVAAPHNQRP